MRYCDAALYPSCIATAAPQYRSSFLRFRDRYHVDRDFRNCARKLFLDFCLRALCSPRILFSNRLASSQLSLHREQIMFAHFVIAASDLILFGSQVGVSLCPCHRHLGFNSASTLGYNATSQLRYTVAELWRSSIATATLLLRYCYATAALQ